MKKQKVDNDTTLELSETYTEDSNYNNAFNHEEIKQEHDKSPILENKRRSFKKNLTNTYSVLKKLSKFPRTTLDADNVVESKFFNVTAPPEQVNRNPFKVEPKVVEIDTQCSEIPDTQENSQKENSPCNSPKKTSPVLEPSPRGKNPFRVKMESEVPKFDVLSEDAVIECTYPMEQLITPMASQVRTYFCLSPLSLLCEALWGFIGFQELVIITAYICPIVGHRPFRL